jgi:hypothetical protein
MQKLIHFGCSFAVGNGVPDYIKGIESGARATNVANKSTFKKKYGVHAEYPNVLGQKAWADLLEPMVEKILNAD